MSLVQLTSPLCIYVNGPGHSPGVSTINAVGESHAVIGRVRLVGGSGSKTLSSAGGKIIFGANLALFGAGSTYRVGVQDVDSTGLEDGAWDTYKDLVGGTYSFVVGWNTAILDNGSKNIAHGDLIAIVLEMTARNGTDALNVRTTISATGIPSVGLFPYGSSDTGSPTKTNAVLWACLIFDDGTAGWIEGLPILTQQALTQSTAAFNTGTTPDEYGMLFQVPFRARLGWASFVISNVASADDFEMVLYSDPLGTPTVVRTVTVDADLVSNISTHPFVGSFADILEPNTDYVLAIRPTTANSLSWVYYDMGSGYDVLKKQYPLPVLKDVSRSDQTGAFAETQAYYLPMFGLGFDQIDNGLSAGGSSRIFGSPVFG